MDTSNDPSPITEAIAALAIVAVIGTNIPDLIVDAVTWTIRTVTRLLGGVA